MLNKFALQRAYDLKKQGCHRDVVEDALRCMSTYQERRMILSHIFPRPAEMRAR